MVLDAKFILSNLLLEGGLVSFAVYELVKLRRDRRRGAARQASEELTGHPEGQKTPDDGGPEAP